MFWLVFISRIFCDIMQYGTTVDSDSFKSKIEFARKSNVLCCVRILKVISTWLSRIIPISRSVDYDLLILFSILKYSGIIGNSKWARIQIHVRIIVYTSCYNLVPSYFFSLRHLKTAVMTSISSNNRAAGKLSKHCLSLEQKIKILDENKKRKRKSCREIVEEFKIG